MAWRIEFERVAARELDKLVPQAAEPILRFLRDRVAPLDDPRSIGEALQGERFGDIGWSRGLRTPRGSSSCSGSDIAAKSIDEWRVLT